MLTGGSALTGKPSSPAGKKSSNKDGSKKLFRHRRKPSGSSKPSWMNCSSCLKRLITKTRWFPSLSPPSIGQRCCLMPSTACWRKPTAPSKSSSSTIAANRSNRRWLPWRLKFRSAQYAMALTGAYRLPAIAALLWRVAKSFAFLTTMTVSCPIIYKRWSRPCKSRALIWSTPMPCMCASSLQTASVTSWRAANPSKAFPTTVHTCWLKILFRSTPGLCAEH